MDLRKLEVRKVGITTSEAPRKRRSGGVMKDFIILLVICVIVVLAVGWYLLPGPAHNLFRTSVAVQSPAPEPEKPAPPPTPPHKVVAVHKAEEPPVAEPVAVVTPAPVAIIPLPVIVPAPGEVTLGVERSGIIDSYGNPALSASTVDRGHLFETMVYRHERQQAVIRLEDGKVSWVYAR